MPMGFLNASSVFQRIMDKILEEEIRICCYVYVDNILVFSNSKAEHKKDLIRVCSKIIKAGLTANKAKFMIAQETVDFIGYRISKDRIEPLIDKKKSNFRLSCSKEPR
ncbi:Retrovirus-related Pol polyprotein from transposon gypsy [Nosema granulosis]|uniref:Retrovirus-related Pol polyprotein from transposon gypsy n=1 Tax=Nosema granulosis TaxID=83296 RepID=A0A9P6KX70_9MICR|nr:Retrovirus-related Pol polyprotein from transposon gypsy [Nosema granulosis]